MPANGVTLFITSRQLKLSRGQVNHYARLYSLRARLVKQARDSEHDPGVKRSKGRRTVGGSRSLGLIQPGQPIRLTIPPDLAGHLTPDAALAVSLEPPGGSPTGLPTGPVIASGKLTSL